MAACAQSFTVRHVWYKACFTYVTAMHSRLMYCTSIAEDTCPLKMQEIMKGCTDASHKHHYVVCAIHVLTAICVQPCLDMHMTDNKTVVRQRLLVTWLDFVTELINIVPAGFSQ